MNFRKMILLGVVFSVGTMSLPILGKQIYQSSFTAESYPSDVLMVKGGAEGTDLARSKRAEARAEPVEFGEVNQENQLDLMVLRQKVEAADVKTEAGKGMSQQQLDALIQNIIAQKPQLQQKIKGQEKETQNLQAELKNKQGLGENLNSSEGIVSENITKNLIDQDKSTVALVGQENFPKIDSVTLANKSSFQVPQKEGKIEVEKPSVIEEEQAMVRNKNPITLLDSDSFQTEHEKKVEKSSVIEAEKDLFGNKKPIKLAQNEEFLMKQSTKAQGSTAMEKEVKDKKSGIQKSQTQQLNQENEFYSKRELLKVPREKGIDLDEKIENKQIMLVEEKYKNQPLITSQSLKEELEEKQKNIEKKETRQKKEILKVEPQLEIVKKGTPKSLLFSEKKKFIPETEDSQVQIITLRETEEELFETQTDSEGMLLLKAGESIQDWIAKPGDTLRGLLTAWGEKSGWTVIWALERDYHLQAGVVFRGRFFDVSGALIRSFARANPAPIGTFYKGNRVLVISAQEEENGY